MNGTLCAQMPISMGMLLGGMAIMAGITYLCRVLTLVLVRKKITNRFLRSILTYIPFGVLSAMVFPEIFYATAQYGADGGLILMSLIPAAVGAAVAIALALFKRGLFTVAMSATVAVFAVSMIMNACGAL